MFKSKYILYRASFYYLEQKQLMNSFHLMYNVIKKHLSFCNIQLITPKPTLLKTRRWEGWFNGNVRVKLVSFHNLEDTIHSQSCSQSSVIVSYIMRRIYYLILKSKLMWTTHVVHCASLVSILQICENIAW